MGTITRFTPPSTTPTVVATGLGEPIDMAFGDDGNLYCTDYASSGPLWQITPGGTKTAFATFSYPAALTRDAAGNFHVGEYVSGAVFKVSPAGASTLDANMPVSTGARLTALYVSPSGKLFCGSLGGYIYLISPGGGSLSLFSSGLGSIVGLVAGPLLSARFNYPAGIVLLDGRIYVAEYGNGDIREIDGLGTVAIEPESFGSVKSMFRQYSHI